MCIYFGTVVHSPYDQYEKYSKLYITLKYGYLEESWDWSYREGELVLCNADLRTLEHMACLSTLESRFARLAIKRNPWSSAFRLFFFIKLLLLYNYPTKPIISRNKLEIILLRKATHIWTQTLISWSWELYEQDGGTIFLSFVYAKIWFYEWEYTADQIEQADVSTCFGWILAMRKMSKTTTRQWVLS